MGISNSSQSTAMQRHSLGAVVDKTFERTNVFRKLESFTIALGAVAYSCVSIGCKVLLIEASSDPILYPVASKWAGEDIVVLEIQDALF